LREPPTTTFMSLLTGESSFSDNVLQEVCNQRAISMKT
jgi:hypothetical protein